ncbi:MAG: ABC transporter ATP-binding protein, partial [Planctomycetaceae bacterium]|nr:ABC transporter ATP-binding protein [Planctomycetaceae bacterium]
MISAFAAVLAAALLVLLLLCCGGLTELLVHAERGDGLMPLADRPNEGPLHFELIRTVVRQVPLLQRSVPALTGLLVLGCVCTLLRSLLHDRVRRSIRLHVSAAVSKLREHIHRHALRCNTGDLTGRQKKPAARLFRETADRLEDSATHWGFDHLTSLIDLAVLVLLMLLINWRVGAECLVPVIVCWHISRLEINRHAASTTLLSEQVERGIRRLTDDLDNAQMVAGYGMEESEHQQFSEALNQYRSRYHQLRRQQTHGRWMLMLIRLISVALPGYLIARHILAGDSLGLSAAVMLSLTVGLITSSLRTYRDVAVSESAAVVAADEIQQYLLRVPPVSQVVGAKFLEPMSRILVFDQVRVETETNPDLLSGLDLRIEAGQRISLLSLNPMETEALISLIPRFLDPVSGQVLIDGQDLRRATLESLRAEVLIVHGDAPVFNGTVLENITSRRSDISRQDAIEAGKLVHAESFIRRLPANYETMLGEHGTPLEPGQKFRLHLARAAARKPAVMIIREPEAPLDTETKTLL